MFFVSIVENNRFVRDGFELVLEQSNLFSLVGAYRDLAQAFRDSELPRSHLLLIDLKLPGKSAIQGIRQLVVRHPHILPLAFVLPENDTLILQAIAAGAVGFVSKQAIPSELLKTLKLVCRGGSPLNPSIARKFLALSNKSPRQKRLFTPREEHLLRLMAVGLSANVVARECSLSQICLFQTIREIYRKIQQMQIESWE